MFKKIFKKVPLTLYDDSEEKARKRWKKNDSSDANNNSTFSLHIAVYENSIEAASDSFDGKINEGFEKKKPTSPFVIQNPFEFPRQQNSEMLKPEVSKFKTSQRLINPNKASNNNQKKTSQTCTFEAALGLLDEKSSNNFSTVATTTSVKSTSFFTSSKTISTTETTPTNSDSMSSVTSDETS
uniref:Uncharacterized protein n=1 Tax=Panagrolaimus sp. PS1159 TaxID=55785 RepID=A0AC35GUA2_9BILA